MFAPLFVYVCHLKSWICGSNNATTMWELEIEDFFNICSSESVHINQIQKFQGLLKHHDEPWSIEYFKIQNLDQGCNISAWVK